MVTVHVAHVKFCLLNWSFSTLRIWMLMDICIWCGSALRLGSKYQQLSICTMSRNAIRQQSLPLWMVRQCCLHSFSKVCVCGMFGHQKWWLSPPSIHVFLKRLESLHNWNWDYQLEKESKLGQKDTPILMSSAHKKDIWHYMDTAEIKTILIKRG